MGDRSAIVTGASRGIGKACALALAERGFDVTVCARTVRPGERYEHSLSLQQSDDSPLPGSLEETVAAVAERGTRAQAVRLDLDEPADAERAVAAHLAEYGGVDVVVNSAVYTAPGVMDPFLATPIDIHERMLRCNVLTPLTLCQTAARAMVDRGGGRILNIDAMGAWEETPLAVGQGGWGLGFSISKAAFHRATAGLAKELRDHGIAVVNVEPGLTRTERYVNEYAQYEIQGLGAVPLDAVAGTVATLATCRHPLYWSGRTVMAFEFAVEHELVDGDALPGGYGPAGWGFPQFTAWPVPGPGTLPG
jgi:NAD(P)-dependent dehydrogenase (short-subunit alcohol dehydrogenase family)